MNILSHRRRYSPRRQVNQPPNGVAAGAGSSATPSLCAFVRFCALKFQIFLTSISLSKIDPFLPSHGLVPFCIFRQISSVNISPKSPPDALRIVRRPFSRHSLALSLHPLAFPQNPRHFAYFAKFPQQHFPKKSSGRASNRAKTFQSSSLSLEPSSFSLSPKCPAISHISSN